MTGAVASPPSESRAERATRFLGGLLSRWGVDARQYHWLLQASLKMDFRSTNPFSRRGSETKSALRNTVFMNLVFSGIMSLLLAPETNTFFFAVIMLGYGMAMVAMMILTEFGLAVISPDDHLILAHRPVSSRTFLAVRFSNLMFYVLVLDGSLSLAPALAGWLCRGSRWWFPGVYLVVATGAGFFVAGAVVAFYGFLMRWFNYEKFKDVLVYCQVALSFLFFFGYQLIPRLAGAFHGVNIVRLTHGWGALFPSVWFAALAELGIGHWSMEALACGAAGLLLTCVALPGLFRAISLDYSENIGRLVNVSGKGKLVRAGRRGGGWSVWRPGRLFGDAEERAFFSFVVAMFRRNRQLKLQLYPNFGIMIAMFVLAVMDNKNLSDPFSTHGTASMVVSFTSMAFVFGAVGMANLLPYSDEYAGGWIFQVAPVRKPETVLRAVKKAALLFFFLPLLLLNTVLFSFFWPPLHALELGVYGLLLGSVAFQLALFQFRGFPFTRKLEKGAQSRQFVLLMMLISILGIAVLLPMLLSHSQEVVAGTCAGLLALNLALGFAGNRRFARRLLAPEPAGG